MPSNIFANTGTNISVILLDKANKSNNVILIDASKLGSKIKDGNNQKTVLSDEESQRIIDTFLAHQSVDDFAVVVPYEDMISKNCSFSAGQYFEIKTEHIDITEEEFNRRMEEYKSGLLKKFQRGHELEKSILEQMGKGYLK